MKVLALDAGVANLGVAVFEHRLPSGFHDERAPGYGPGWEVAELLHIFTEANPRKQKIRTADVDMERVMEATRKLAEVVKRHDIKRMAVEVPHGGAQSAMAMKYLSMAGSIAACTAAHFDLFVEFYSPQDVRRTLCGKSSASKDEAAAVAIEAYPVLLEQFPTKGKREHVADSVAVFLTALRTGNVCKF